MDIDSVTLSTFDKLPLLAGFDLRAPNANDRVAVLLYAAPSECTNGGIILVREITKDGPTGPTRETAMVDRVRDGMPAALRRAADEMEAMLADGAFIIA